jgi:hypothetical protein
VGQAEPDFDQVPEGEHQGREQGEEADDPDARREDDDDDADQDPEAGVEEQRTTGGRGGGDIAWQLHQGCPGLR